jgi:hypothetical protein
MFGRCSASRIFPENRTAAGPYNNRFILNIARRAPVVSSGSTELASAKIPG